MITSSPPQTPRFICVCVCVTEQLESFKKHMDAGETNTPAIILGEENEEDGDICELCVCAVCELCV